MIGTQADASNKCFKCGCVNKQLFNHHTSYDPEIVVLCCMSCHKKIHIRLRKEGKCKIPVEVLKRIHNHSKSTRILNNRYKKKVIQRIDFVTVLLPNIRFREVIRYNLNTGAMCYVSYIDTNHRKNIPILNI